MRELTLAVTTTASGTQSVLVDGGGLTLDALAGVHLVVLKFEFDPALADTVSLFLDPTDSIEANYTPAATISVAESDLLITHHGAITNFTFSGGGHIPGARNIPWSKAVNDDGTFKSADELRKLYEGAGVDFNKPTIAYCRIGERSSHTWFVLKYLLGAKNIKNYDGSWTEWGNLVGAPIEKGEGASATAAVNCQ